MLIYTVILEKGFKKLHPAACIAELKKQMPECGFLPFSAKMYIFV